MWFLRCYDVLHFLVVSSGSDNVVTAHLVLAASETRTSKCVGETRAKTLYRHVGGDRTSRRWDLPSSSSTAVFTQYFKHNTRMHFS